MEKTQTFLIELKATWTDEDYKPTIELVNNMAKEMAESGSDGEAEDPDDVYRVWYEVEAVTRMISKTKAPS